jgi:hypothetical protein
MGELVKYMKERKNSWNINRGWHKKELPGNFYITNQQEGQKEDGLMFKEGTLADDDDDDDDDDDVVY